MLMQAPREERSEQAGVGGRRHGGGRQAESEGENGDEDGGWADREGWREGGREGKRETQKHKHMDAGRHKFVD